MNKVESISEEQFHDFQLLGTHIQCRSERIAKSRQQEEIRKEKEPTIDVFKENAGIGEDRCPICGKQKSPSIRCPYCYEEYKKL